MNTAILWLTVGWKPKLMFSLRRLGELKEDYTVYPGHMNTTTLAREKAMNPYLRQALR